MSACGLFTVRGNATAPHIADRNIFLVDMNRNKPGDIADGKICVFSESDMVKARRLIRRGPKIMVRQDRTPAMAPG